MTGIKFDQERLGRVSHEAWRSWAGQRPGMRGPDGILDWDEVDDNCRAAEIARACAIAAEILADARLFILEIPEGMDGWHSTGTRPVTVALSPTGEARVHLTLCPGHCDYDVTPKRAREIAVTLARTADLAEAQRPDPQLVDAIAGLVKLGEGRREIAAAIIAALPGLGYEKRETP